MVQQLKNNNGSQLPLRSSPEAAGYDIYSIEPVSIPAWTRKLVPTGLRFILPANTYARIAPRSGLSLLGVDIAAGVVDRDYTGEVKVLVVNNSYNEFNAPAGTRICQVILEQIATPIVHMSNSNKISSNSDSKRGKCGFGQLSGFF